MSDLIDRQAAIDALKDAMLAWSTMPEWREDRILDVLVGLPSAQPETIRCKDCKHYETHGHRCKVWNHGVIVMGYCYRAERRTDG